jgi:hypothetical protein
MRGKHLISQIKRILFLLPMLLPGVLCAQETVCIKCHSSLPGRLGEPVKLWRGSIHAANGISCNNCHGGDPTDMAMAMSPARGFLGKPSETAIPGFCGRCHVGVEEDYLKSAHGRALGHGGPQCVTCHSNHHVVDATPDLINIRSCTRCHSYGRAEEIKSAVASTDGMISTLEKQLDDLHRLGIDTKELKGELFSLRNRFHRIFHTVDVEMVRSQTAGFQVDIGKIRASAEAIEKKLERRKLWGGIAVALLICGGILSLLIYRSYRHEI